MNKETRKYKYSHLITFTFRTKQYVMKSIQTKNEVITLNEWNDFVIGLFGDLRSDWIVLHKITFKI